MRDLLANLERSDADLPASLAYLAGQAVELDVGEARGALRRAELLLAAGGDPRRELEPDGRAVTALAADLDGEDVRAQLRAALEQLAAEADGLPRVAAAVGELLADDELAWRSFACARLAEALAG
jgi:multidrug resistance efflux pump